MVLRDCIAIQTTETSGTSSYPWELGICWQRFEHKLTKSSTIEWMHFHRAIWSHFQKNLLCTSPKTCKLSKEGIDYLWTVFGQNDVKATPKQLRIFHLCPRISTFTWIQSSFGLVQFLKRHISSFTMVFAHLRNLKNLSTARQARMTRWSQIWVAAEMTYRVTFLFLKPWKQNWKACCCTSYCS